MKGLIADVLRHYSIKRKLMTCFLLLIFVGISVTTTAFMANQFYRLNQSAHEELKTQAQILARNTSAALTFADKAAAHEILTALKANPRIVAALVFAADNTLFTHYVAENSDHSRLRSEISYLLHAPSDPKALFKALKIASGAFHLLEMRPLVS
ncbi:MAG: CHASE sensor domain-containing protein, partial [Deltaproteobacteria bacterium]